MPFCPTYWQANTCRWARSLSLIHIFTGILCGILYAILLKFTKYKGEPVPFVMELPNYRFPSARSVCQLIWEKARDFLQKAFKMCIRDRLWMMSFSLSVSLNTVSAL